MERLAVGVNGKKKVLMITIKIILLLRRGLERIMEENIH